MDYKSTTEVWAAGYTIPRKHVKPITGKSYSGDSPRPHWVIQRLTEMFGPAGQGWGCKILREWIEPAPFDKGTAVHFAHIGLWYVANGKTSELIEAIGGTEYAGYRKNGNAYVDDDAPKKSITDGLVKAASWLGIAGEIFMGDYNANQPHGSKYEAEAAQPEDKPPAANKASKDDKPPASEPPQRQAPTFKELVTEGARSGGITENMIRLYLLHTHGLAPGAKVADAKLAEAFRDAWAWIRSGGLLQLVDEISDAGKIAMGGTKDSTGSLADALEWINERMAEAKR